MRRLPTTRKVLLLALATLMLGGCSSGFATIGTSSATLAPPTKNRQELLSLPKPKGKIKVAVYNFRDQTGQYKPLPGVSSFSTAVSQGGTSMLTQALRDSGWFIIVEREGLQNLLTERKIIRAYLEKQGGNIDQELPPLDMATVLIEGGIIGYDSNIVTGGAAGRYFGAGGSLSYRVDQVTVALRAVDIRTGRVLKSISTSKTVLSREVTAGLFRFVSFQRLLEAEAGFTTNEPVQLAVQGAVEKGVASLVIEGVVDNLWALNDPRDIKSEVIKGYLEEAQGISDISEDKVTATKIFISSFEQAEERKQNPLPEGALQ